MSFFDKAALVRLCHYKAMIYRLINLAVYHAQYGIMVWVARRHWTNKRTERLEDERRFMERVLSRRISA